MHSHRFRIAACVFVCAASFLCGPSAAQDAAEFAWRTLETTGQPTARHEAALVAYQDQLILIGGRRINPVDVFDPLTKRWTAKSTTPLELHHFQAVVIDEAIYLMGAMTGGWPRETPLEKVVVYYPQTDRFEFVHSIPAARRRGGAGAVVYQGKIYLVGGITNGHMDGYQPWLDTYDPKTGDWEILPDAPHARDHFQAVVINDRLIAAAGRTTSQKDDHGFDLTVPEIDVFDLAHRKWLPEYDCPSIPTPRAGNMALAFDGKLILAGGESGKQKSAHSEVEVYDTKTQQWTQWPKLQRGRHGSGLAVVGDQLYTASGSGNRGGGPELTSVESLQLPSPTTAAKSAVSANRPTEVRLWHPLTLSFNGPKSNETAEVNPFTDYRLLVRFRQGNHQLLVRGFYAADGNAAETGADSGNVWQVRFAPDRTGDWSYEADLRMGTDIAIDDDPNAGTPVSISDPSGNFTVSKPTPDDENSHSRYPAARDFTQRGRLTTDGRYFRFAHGGAYWLKGGTDSPENLLAYADFDGTYRISSESTEGEAKASDKLHAYQPHATDWRPGDPTWRGDRGKGLIGALNYLASKGMNSAYFLTMNIGGDGKDVWPFINPEDFERFDCSKLDQWEIVFRHMQRHGMLMHLVTQETENETLFDQGDTGRIRKLYYRELIARFAHHPALIWNLGEENGPAEWTPLGQTNAQQLAMAQFLKTHDPYQHPVVLHTHSTPESKDEILPGLLGANYLDGLAFQVDERTMVHDEIVRWHNRSRAASKTWLIGMDEIGKWHTGVTPDVDTPQHSTIRRHALWGSLLAGAAGVEWYFGAKFPSNDLTCEDFRTRDRLWELTRHALDFFEKIPYWEMRPLAETIQPSEAFCFGNPGRVYAIYLPSAASLAGDAAGGNPIQSPRAPVLDLTGTSGTYSVRWFNPLEGGPMRTGSIQTVSGGAPRSLGNPPSLQVQDQTVPSDQQDWVVLIARQP